MGRRRYRHSPRSTSTFAPMSVVPVFLRETARQYLEQVLVLSFHVPPASMQSPSVLAFLISSIPAKAGAVKVRPVKASARINAKTERRVFMASTPLGRSETVAGLHFPACCLPTQFPYRRGEFRFHDISLSALVEREVRHSFLAGLQERPHVVIATGWWLPPARAFFGRDPTVNWRILVGGVCGWRSEHASSGGVVEASTEN